MASSARSEVIVHKLSFNQSSEEADVAEEPVYALHIPSSLIWSWKDTLSGPRISMLNMKLCEGMQLKPTMQMKERLRKKVSSVVSIIKNKNRRARNEYLIHNYARFDVFKNELIDISGLRSKVVSLEESLKEVTEECKKKK